MNYADLQQIKALKTSPCSADTKCRLLCDSTDDFEPAAFMSAANVKRFSEGDNYYARAYSTATKWAKVPLYDEHAMNLMRVRQFALESASGHLGALIDDQRRLLAWAYSKLHHVSFTKQEDALALDEIKLMMLEAA